MNALNFIYSKKTILFLIFPLIFAPFLVGCSPKNNNDRKGANRIEATPAQKKSMQNLLKYKHTDDAQKRRKRAQRFVAEIQCTQDSLLLSQGYSVIGETFYFEQQIDSALNNWKKALAYLDCDVTNQNRAALLSNLGSAYLFKGYNRIATSYFLDARCAYKKEARKTTNYWLNYLNLGVSFMELKNYKMASFYFDQIPFNNDPKLDVIVPLNYAKMYAQQHNLDLFKKYIAISLKNKNHVPFYNPILREVHLGFIQKTGSFSDLEKIYRTYLPFYRKESTNFDLLVWKSGINLGKPPGKLLDLMRIKKTISRSDYHLLVAYYETLGKWYEVKGDYKNACLAKNLLAENKEKLHELLSKDILGDFNLLSKRYAAQEILKEEKYTADFQTISTRNKGYVMVLLFSLLLSISISIFITQRKKSEITRKELKVQELELQLVNDQQKKLKETLEFKTKKIQNNIDSISKIASLKKQLDTFFSTMEKSPELWKESKTMVKKAKLDFNFFFKSYQELNGLPNLLASDSNNLQAIKNKYPDLKENELIVLLLIQYDYTSKEIALLLSFSEKNIEYYRMQLRKKLEVSKDVNLNDFIRENFN